MYFLVQLVVICYSRHIESRVDSQLFQSIYKLIIPKVIIFGLLSQFYCSPWLCIYQLYHNTMINQFLVLCWKTIKKTMCQNMFLLRSKPKTTIEHKRRYLWVQLKPKKTHVPNQVFTKIKTQNYHKAQTSCHAPNPTIKIGTWQWPYAYKVFTLQVCKVFLATKSYPQRKFHQ